MHRRDVFGRISDQSLIVGERNVRRSGTISLFVAISSGWETLRGTLQQTWWCAHRPLPSRRRHCRWYRDRFRWQHRVLRLENEDEKKLERKAGRQTKSHFCFPSFFFPVNVTCAAVMEAAKLSSFVKQHVLPRALSLEAIAPIVAQCNVLLSKGQHQQRHLQQRKKALLLKSEKLSSLGLKLQSSFAAQQARIPERFADLLTVALD